MRNRIGRIETFIHSLIRSNIIVEDVVPAEKTKSLMYIMHLPHAVTAVNKEIGTSHVRASIANQVDIGTLQFLGLTIATHGDHRVPEVLDVLLHKVRQTSVDVSGRNAVDASKVAPLVGQRTGHVDTASLGDVV